MTVDEVARKLAEEQEGEWDDVPPGAAAVQLMEEVEELLSELSIWQISTLKRRRKKMNKHKLRKRKKKLRLKTRK